MGKHRWPTAGDSVLQTPPAGTLHPVAPALPGSGELTAATAHSALRPPHTGRYAGEGPAQRPGRSAPEDHPDDEADTGEPQAPGSRPDDEDHRASQAPVQWRVARSAALVFLGVALAIGGALFLVRSSEPSVAAVSVELEPAHLEAGLDEAPREDPAGGGDGQSGGTAGSAGAGAGSREGAGPDGPGDNSGNQGVPAGEPGAGTGAAAPTIAGVQAELVIYLTGAVTAPGVVAAPPGTRLFEFIERAGGPTPDADLEGINLAAVPSDGAHVHLLAVGEEPRAASANPPDGSGTPLGQPQGGPTGGAAVQQPGDAGGTTDEVSGGTAGLIDLNAASLTDLQTLPRIGPVLGQRILDWRAENGPFTQPADLDAVPGIGPAMLEGILPLVIVR